MQNSAKMEDRPAGCNKEHNEGNQLMLTKYLPLILHLILAHASTKRIFAMKNRDICFLQREDKVITVIIKTHIKL